MAKLPSKALKFGARKGSEFLTRLLIRRGFKTDDGSLDTSSVTSLGLIGQAITPAERIENVPTLERPRKAIAKSNPNLITLGKQLDSLVKLAGSIGVLSKKHQELLVENIKQANKVARENNLERKTQPERQAVNQDSLAPLGDIVADIAKTLGKLNGVVEQKQEEVADSKPSFLENFLDRRGFGNDYRESKTKRKAKREAAAAKRVYERSVEGRASKFKPEQLLDKNGKPLNRSQLPLRLGRLEREAQRGTVLGRVKSAGSSLVRAATSNSIAKKIGKGLAAGTARATVGRDAMKTTVKKLAGPLISKALGSTALKSIPIIGAVAGLGFAASRLVEGDVVGAGLDAASGLGGPMTAIPALVASIARDIYSDVYGVKPEQDGGFTKRIGALMDSVKETVLEYIKPKIQPKSKVTQAQIDKPFTPKVNASKGGSSGSLFTAPSMPSGSPSDYKPGAGPIKSGTKPYSIPTAFSQKPVNKPSPSSGSELQKPQVVDSTSSPAVAKGVSLIAAQASIDKPQINISSVDMPTLPSVVPTTRDNALGVGNVPNIDYPHNLSGQLYFSSTVMPDA